MLVHHKITTDHLAKKAMVYVRQSSLKQVLHNQESQRLQYALVERARSLGWHQIEVIDDDLGQSASDGTRRVGCKKLLAAVALGDVGMVLSTEASRLSRTDKDWCHLLDICKVCSTLIGDAEHIYDVNLTDDQLILGIKGTLSVMELSVLKSRLFQGQEHKAQRGELYTGSPRATSVPMARRWSKTPMCACRKRSRWCFGSFVNSGVCGRCLNGSMRRALRFR